MSDQVADEDVYF